jgi:DnaJ-class molecular chaperone
MRVTKLMMGSCFALALALLAWGCAGKAGTAAPFDAISGQHPANWIQVHYSSYLATPDQCRTCHGSTSDATQAGGVSKVSCFSCHTNGVDHPANWANHAQHGRLGAQLAPVVTVDPAVPVMAGMAHCTKCHGNDYLGGITNVSCKACHTTAPHPAKPWTDKTTLANSSHTQTDLGNAAACAQCHTAGANSDLKPSTTPAAGTAPGCFNNTLCHGNSLSIVAPVKLVSSQPQ